MLPTIAALLAGGLLLQAIPVRGDDVYCDENTPCVIGCCGAASNVCGMGPDYCADDTCINSCDAKAECNPDDWDAVYYNSSTCPLNVCCSEYGFCGTTESFCGDETVTRPSCDVDSTSIDRVIGYYASAGASRDCDGMVPLSFPQGVYTHIYFAFGSIDPDTFEVVPATSVDESLYPQLAALSTRDLGQELWLSIGGWDFTDSDEATATTFSDLCAADTTTQNAFFSSLTLFMSTWGFTGVDIDWEYPVADDRSGRTEDYDNFPTFLSNLKSALDDYKFGLSITLPTSYWYLQHFDLASIGPSVDWFNFMSYDLHGTWDIGNEWTGAYLNAHTNLTEIESALDLLWRNNITSSKVNMGMAFYGRTFTLADGSCDTPGCMYLSAGDEGTCSGTAGILFNSEISTIISDNDLTPTLYKDAAVKTITWNDDQWVSFDDQETWKIKADFAKSQCLGGVLVWSVDYDDGNHTYSDGLAAALGNEVNLDSDTGLTLTTFTTSEKSTTKTTTTTTESSDSFCHFVNCGASCPSGFSQVTRADKKKQIMLNSTACPDRSLQQVLCCPTSTDVPTCRWRGFNGGACKHGCKDGEAEVGTVSSGCRSGYQSACCETTASTKPWSECAWTSSCKTDDSCPSGYDTFVVSSRDGWGGQPSCDPKKSKKYNYCCKSTIPDAFTNCEWYGHETKMTSDYLCSDSCPSGSIRIAEQSIYTFNDAGATSHTSDPSCIIGNEAYCCKGVTATTSSVGTRSTDAIPTYADSTAEEFDAYLQKFLAAPVCPGDFEAEYSSTVTFAGTKRDVVGWAREDSNGSEGGVVKRATGQSITLTYLVPLMAIWLTSQSPRSDLTLIWDTRLSEAGYGTTASNYSVIEDTLYPDGWSGYMTYSADTLISDLLCNIADSASGLDAIDSASALLCLDSDDYESTKKKKRELAENGTVVANTTLSHMIVTDKQFEELASRRIDEISQDSRNARGDEPTISAVLSGVADGTLSLHYLRYLNPNGDQIILELAFWIGPTPGTAPGTTTRALFGDSTHTAATDRWIVMHFHINLDVHTFLPNQENWYPGVTTFTMYHGQGIFRPAAVTTTGTADYRVEHRYNGRYTINAGAMMNYNARTQALSCNFPSGSQRWYVGVDNAAAIRQANRNGRTTYLAEQLNTFGLWLYAQGVFSVDNLQYIWPTGVYDLGDFPTPTRFNALTAYRPVARAFDENFMPDGSAAPDLRNADP